MTGTVFIERLVREITQHGRLEAEYTSSDLVRDAAVIFRGDKPQTMAEQVKSQEADLAAAREEVAKLEKPGGAV